MLPVFRILRWIHVATKNRPPLRFDPSNSVAGIVRREAALIARRETSRTSVSCKRAEYILNEAGIIERFGMACYVTAVAATDFVNPPRSSPQRLPRGDCAALRIAYCRLSKNQSFRAT